MNVFVTVYIALLFMVLTPGVLLTIPKRGSKLVVAVVHALVFGVVYYFTHKMVWKFSQSLDSFQNKAQTTGYNPTGYPPTTGYMKPGSPPPEVDCKSIENNMENIEKDLQQKTDMKRKMKEEYTHCYKKYTQ